MSGNKKQLGQVMIIAVVLLFIIFTYSLALTGTILSRSQYNKKVLEKNNALWLAEAGIQKALWCLNEGNDSDCGGSSLDSYAGEIVNEDEGTFLTTLSGSDTDYFIKSTGSHNSVSTELTQDLKKSINSTLIEFSNDVISGDSPLLLKHRVRIEGNVYANNNVTCDKDALINGNLYVSGNHDVDNCNVNGDVKAYQIIDSYIEGDAYYQYIQDSIILGNSYPGSIPPPEVGHPITAQMINDWKDDALVGGQHSGDLTISTDQSLGPIYITGKLIIDMDTTLNITGSIYVLDNIKTEKGATLQLDTGFAEASTSLVGEQDINIHKNTIVSGTVEGGKIVLISTKSGGAIDIKKEIAGEVDVEPNVLLFAPFGKVELKSDIVAKHVSADEISLRDDSLINHGVGSWVFYYLKDSLAPKVVTTSVTFSNGAISDSKMIKLEERSEIQGPVYSNYKVECHHESSVTGNITVAGSNIADGCTVTGTVRSSTIKDSSITGNAYYQTIQNTTVSGNEYPGSADPASINYPITTQNIDQWKVDAENGGVYSGDYSASGTVSLGPQRITGKLEIEQDATVTLTGTLYVEGDIFVRKRAQIILDPVFNYFSGVIISDQEIEFAEFSRVVRSPGGGLVLLITTKADGLLNVGDFVASPSSLIVYVPFGSVSVEKRSILTQIGGKEVNLKDDVIIDLGSTDFGIQYVGDNNLARSWSIVTGSRYEQ